MSSVDALEVNSVKTCLLEGLHKGLKVSAMCEFSVLTSSHTHAHAHTHHQLSRWWGEAAGLHGSLGPDHKHSCTMQRRR